MAQDFSDPLTSAAYASSKTASGSDPLLAPTPSPAVNAPLPALASPVRKTKDSHSSSPAVQNSRLGQLTPSTQPKHASPLPTKKATTSTTTKSSRFSEDVSSFSSPSSPLSQPFTDPLDSGHSNGDYEPYTRTKSPAYNSYQHSSSNNNTTNRADSRSTIASFPTHAASSSNLPSSSSQPLAPAVPPPVSPSHSSGPKAVSPPRITRRDSSYDQQRVKAPQYLHITIPDTDRRGKDGMFILSVQTNMPRYKRQSYQNITRSYLEFVRLREHLVAEHPEALVPVLPPERSLVSATDVQSMRLFLERISRHPVLSQDIELQMFIESEFGFLPPAKPKMILGKLLNIGVKRFSSSGGAALSLGDTDDEFEEERAVAAKLETKLQGVIKSLDKEIKARRDFSSKEAELATVSNTWAGNESLPELARTFKLLAKPLDGMAKASKAQVGGDATVLGSFLDYKLQHVQTLSGALDYRLSVVGEYEAAIKSTENKRKIMERLRSSTNINPEKVTDSIDDLEDATLFEGNMRRRMEQVSSALNKDMEGYRVQSQEDLLRALRQYSQRQIGFEKAKLEELLSVGAGLKGDPDSGGSGAGIS
ncbi:Vacuolar protein sorting-associated protein 17 [Linnemannia exigua]|uniref:Vacuolar protein sorting-associated protein 17 n=1 Tax=Linnemannia exigua TaxID=604196 RepID=A0AAD4H7T6_9FUNG|nr:Vacuolar protein sorting-associated protein 17 [Linnemannia exigua]